MKAEGSWHWGAAVLLVTTLALSAPAGAELPQVEPPTAATTVSTLPKDEPIVVGAPDIQQTGSAIVGGVATAAGPTGDIAVTPEETPPAGERASAPASGDGQLRAGASRGQPDGRPPTAVARAEQPDSAATAPEVGPPPEPAPSSTLAPPLLPEPDLPVVSTRPRTRRTLSLSLLAAAVALLAAPSVAGRRTSRVPGP